MASPPQLCTAPGMRERAPGVWELIEGGNDPVTGKRRQVSRVFRGNLRDAKKARAELLVEVGNGKHTGTAASVDGLSPRSVYQIHACLSFMFTQACKWGWRDTNPAQWADPPSIPNTTPVVPDPEQVQRLVEAAGRSRRPEYARALFITATTGVRRAEPATTTCDRQEQSLGLHPQRPRTTPARRCR